MENEPVLCDEAKAYLAMYPRQAPLWERDLEDARREVRDRLIAGGGPPESVAHVEDIEANGVPARLYRPEGDERAALVWIHGGAWMMNDLDAYDSLSRALSNRADCAVLSVDYRLAPEHPYPAGLDDCWAATTWAASRFASLAVGGDSSGGNLAAAVALRARDAHLAFTLQLLVYPVLAYPEQNSFSEAFKARYVNFNGVEGYGEQSEDGLRYIWEQYVPNPGQRNDPEAAPLKTPECAGLAPAYIMTAEHDYLRGEAEAYSERLKAAGVEVTYEEYPGQIHGFFNYLAYMEDGRQAVARAASRLRSSFWQPSGDDHDPSLISSRE